MRNLLFIFIFISLSCNTDQGIEVLTPVDRVCDVMNPIGFSATPLDESVELSFGDVGHFDGPITSCSPQAFDLFISEDGEEFSLITRVEGQSGTFVVGSLENERTYFFQVAAIHEDLDPVNSEIRTVKVGLLPLPTFINNPHASLGYRFELLRLGPDGDKYLFRNSSDDWFVGAISNPSENKVIDDSFRAKWNPHNDNEIIYRAKEYVQILENLEGVTSKALITIDLETGEETILHNIRYPMDFGDVHKPEQYWIGDFNYSIDGMSVYFNSNKDNGSSTLFEKKVFHNIWKLNLATKEIQQISDFLPINFEMKNSVEDPKAPGNFYVLGGTEGEKVEIDGALFNPDKVDIYYYNSFDQSLILVLETIHEEENLFINPSGEKLLIINASSGQEELWSYDLESWELNQVTESRSYRYTKHHYFPNWISDDEFMVSLIHENVRKFAIFKI